MNDVMKCLWPFLSLQEIRFRSVAVLRCGKYIFIPCVLSSRPSGQSCSWILQNFVVVSFITIEKSLNFFCFEF